MSELDKIKGYISTKWPAHAVIDITGNLDLKTYEKFAIFAINHPKAVIVAYQADRALELLLGRYYLFNKDNYCKMEDFDAKIIDDMMNNTDLICCMCKQVAGQSIACTCKEHICHECVSKLVFGSADHSLTCPSCKCKRQVVAVQAKDVMRTL